MNKRTYNTRTRDQILLSKAFLQFEGNPGLDKVGLRELRTLDRFFRFAHEKEITAPTVDDFVTFSGNGTSTRPLDDLRTAFDRLLPAGAGGRENVRDAIRTKRPRSRATDWRSFDEIMEEPSMQTYRQAKGIQNVAIEGLRVLSRFLSFAGRNQIEVPTKESFLDFVCDVASSRRLRILKSVYTQLLPHHPIHLELNKAIRHKSPNPRSRAVKKPRPAAKYRVKKSDLPEEWQGTFRNLRLGVMPSGNFSIPAASVIDNMEDVIREYASAQIAADAKVVLTVGGLRRFLSFKANTSRVTTRHTAVMRLRLFAQIIGVEPLVISAFQQHEKELRHRCKDEVPLKFAKLNNLPSLSKSWALAQGLLIDAPTARNALTRVRLLNESVVIALWMFLPLRLSDGQLCWGRDIAFDGSQYQIDIITKKTGEELRGRLHTRLTPFLDALILRGIDPAYLDEMRSRSQASHLPLFRSVDERMLAKSYPSSVWRKHFHAGAHISRSWIHTELGKLGAGGVEAALALCAQRDPQTHAYYAGESIRRSNILEGQNMINELADETLEYV